MAQDYECFPRDFYYDGFMSLEDLDNIAEYTEMCEKHFTEAVDDYMELHDSLDGFEKRYCGELDSEEDFARHIVESCYDLESRMGDLQHYFDREVYGRDLLIGNYHIVSNSHVFRTH